MTSHPNATPEPDERRPGANPEGDPAETGGEDPERRQPPSAEEAEQDNYANADDQQA
jgi:hypothetical protein